MSVLFDVAYQASLVRLVKRNQLVQGNSALEGSRSAAQTSGLGLGGLLATALPASIAVAASVLLFALSSLSIHRIRHESWPELSQRPRRVWRQVHEGLRFVAGNGFLRAVGLAAAAFQFFFAATMTLLLLFLTRELHLTGTAVGLALAATGPGALVGSLALAVAFCFTPQWEAWVSVNADEWFMVALPIAEGFAIISGVVLTVIRREFLTSLGALVAGTALTGGLLWIAL